MENQEHEGGQPVIRKASMQGYKLIPDLKINLLPNKYIRSTKVCIHCILQKRREKINERLRVLQNLVPNGTKVGNILLRWPIFVQAFHSIVSN
jgi:hypothetical protein